MAYCIFRGGESCMAQISINAVGMPKLLAFKKIVPISVSKAKSKIFFY